MLYKPAPPRRLRRGGRGRGQLIRPSLIWAGWWPDLFDIELIIAFGDLQIWIVWVYIQIHGICHYHINIDFVWAYLFSGCGCIHYTWCRDGSNTVFAKIDMIFSDALGQLSDHSVHVWFVIFVRIICCSIWDIICNRLACVSVDIFIAWDNIDYRILKICKSIVIWTAIYRIQIDVGDFFTLAAW